MSQFLSAFPLKATGNFPSVAADSVSQVQEKFPRTPVLPRRKTEIQFYPAKGEGEFTEDASRAQGNQATKGGQQAKAADAPNTKPAIRDRIVLAEPATKILWQMRGPSTLEVFLPETKRVGW